MAMRRAAARSGEWAQHFSNASCLNESGLSSSFSVFFLYLFWINLWLLLL